jgi:hypothetical protein
MCSAPDDVPPKVIEGKGNDISPTGVSFFIPEAPSAQQVYLNLAAPGAESLAILARIVRVRPLRGGLFEVGARFVGLPEPKKHQW